MAEQSQDDLHRHLNEQLGFLKADAEGFDRGNRAQAKRLALGVRVLLHDTDRSRSLLGLLGLKDRPFIDTASPRPDGDIRTSYAGLVGTTFFAGPSEFIPHLNEVETRPVPFDEWWTAPIIADAQQRTISRRDLILNLANKDGGAHVDPKLDEVYAAVSRGNAMGRMRGSGDQWEPIPGLEHASARQIAHEVIVTLDATYAPVKIDKGSYLVLNDPEIRVSFGAPHIAKVGRNELCPCGSGVKYKRCHGR